MFGAEGAIAWLGFLIFVLVLIVIDLGLFSRKSHVISLREAGLMSALWIGVAILFGVFVYLWLGRTSGIEYFTGWLLEKSLSVDNLFVFVVIFNYFRVEPQFQRRVLVWGILGALAMRAAFILLGTSLVAVTELDIAGVHFNPVILLFGIFLIYTGLHIARQDDDEEPDLERNIALRIMRRFVRLTDRYHDDQFSVIQAGRRIFTPLILVLVVIETTDLLFAVDSIPAIIGITKDPFIVFTSNVMAILGLRALYFLLASVIDRFYYLKYALAVILTFVGAKMVVEDWLLERILHVDKEQMAIATLIFVLFVLGAGIVASVLRNARGAVEAEAPNQ